MHPHDSILVISGTNRPNSSTLRVARRVEQLYHETLVNAQLLNLEALPIEAFHPDAYKTKPAAFVAIQERVLNSAGLQVGLLPALAPVLGAARGRVVTAPALWTQQG